MSLLGSGERRAIGACIEWAGSKYPNGYGERWNPEAKRSMRAYRIEWEMHYGPIPTGLYVLHGCDNKPCININHLWLGTPQDNMDDMVAKGRQGQNRCQLKTHCPQGHAYAGDNLYNAPSRVHRICRVCQRASEQRYHQRKKPGTVESST